MNEVGVMQEERGRWVSQGDDRQADRSDCACCAAAVPGRGVWVENTRPPPASHPFRPSLPLDGARPLLVHPTALLYTLFTAHRGSPNIAPK